MRLTGKKTVRGAKPMEPASVSPALSCILATDISSGSIFLQRVNVYQLYRVHANKQEPNETLAALGEDLHSPMRAMMSLKQFPSSSAKICAACQTSSCDVQKCYGDISSARYLLKVRSKIPTVT